MCLHKFVRTWDFIEIDHKLGIPRVRQTRRAIDAAIAPGPVINV